MRGMPVDELLSVRSARPARTRRRAWRPALGSAALVLALGALAGCSGGSNPVSNAVGVSNGVSLATSTGVTYIYQANAMGVSAQITNTNTAIVAGGVTWSLLPGSVGALSNQTLTTVTYTAPGGVVGVQTATLVATANLDSTQVAQATISVYGSPVILPQVVFPANLNIGYAAAISASGGTAPFVWTLKSGTLPPGLLLNGSATATVVASGTPTTLGVYPFVLTTTDTLGNVATSGTITITVNPQLACLLQGQFAYFYTGYRGFAPITRAGSLTIASNGSITGIQDYKDDITARIANPVTSGTCTTISLNRGQLVINSAGEQVVFDYAVNGALSAGQLEQDDATGIVGSGQFVLQQPAAFPVATLAGDHAFGVVGAAGDGARLGVIGRLTSDATGAIDAASSVFDDNEATPLAAHGLTGSFSATDANGRGTASLTFGQQAVTFAYYVVDANTVFLASADTDKTKPRLAGLMTMQVGAGSFGVASLAAPGVLSLWGSSMLNGLRVATTAVGLWSTDAQTAPGTLNVLLDVVNQGVATFYQPYAGAPYAVAANGRATLGLGAGAAERDFVLYLDGLASGYVLEPASATGNFGILQAQTGAPFDNYAPTNYVGGTIFAAAPSPITLAPELEFSNGSILGNLTGYYAIDAPTGRMIASVGRNILGGSGLVAYIVSPTKLVVMGDGVLVDNSAIAWLQSF
jgi:hypothetical protein